MLMLSKVCVRLVSLLDNYTCQRFLFAQKESMSDPTSPNSEPTSQPETPASAETSPSANLQEVSLSWAGKIFFAGIASYLTGIGLQRAGAAVAPKLPFKIRGTPQQIKAVVDALMASKAFQQELKRPGATVESVIEKLNLRNMTKERFKQITGKAWPI